MGGEQAIQLMDTSIPGLVERLFGFYARNRRNGVTVRSRPSERGEGALLNGLGRGTFSDTATDTRAFRSSCVCVQLESSVVYPR